jgi:hypothetical protein
VKNLKTKKKTHVAVDKIIGLNISESTKNQVKFNLQEFADKFEHRKTKGLPKSLRFVIGMRYMVTTNLDVDDGLFNGAVGKLKFLEISNQRLEAVYLEFDDSSVGGKARESRKLIIKHNKLPDTWTPIIKQKLTFRVTRNKTQVCRQQFPLVEAEATTFHKSQGRSLNQVVIQTTTITRMRLSLQMLYVGLSRATTLNGLYIVGDLNIPTPTQDELKALGELEKLRLSPLILKFAHLAVPNHNYIQLISFNIQSVNAHLETIKADGVFKLSDMIMLQETWTANDLAYHIPEFNEIVRNNFPTPAARGTMIYAAEKYLNSINNARCFEFSSNQKIEITACSVGCMHIINIYRHPDTSKSLENLENALQPLNDYLYENNVLIFGDFNYDLSGPNEMENFFLKFGLKLLSPRNSTTNVGTTIDGIFGRLVDYDYRCDIYESYVSHHKPLIIQVRQKLE